MNNIVLSVDISHNSTVGLSINGEIKCLLSEERICRLKNTFSWPKNAIDYAVDTYLNGDISKINKVVFPSDGLFFVDLLNIYDMWEKPRNLGYYWHDFQKSFDIAKHRSKLHYICTVVRTIFDRNNKHFRALITREYITHYIAVLFFPWFASIFINSHKAKNIKKLENTLGIDRSKFVFLNHHTAHNLAAFCFVDINKKYLMFSLDGAGDGLSASVAVAGGGGV